MQHVYTYKARAICLPSPRVPPVINAVFPFRLYKDIRYREIFWSIAATVRALFSPPGVDAIAIDGLIDQLAIIRFFKLLTV